MAVLDLPFYFDEASLLSFEFLFGDTSSLIS